MDKANPSLQLLTCAQVARICEIHPKTIWKWLREGKFPQPVRLGARSVRWTLGSIEQFLARTATPATAATGSQKRTL